MGIIYKCRNEVVNKKNTEHSYPKQLVFDDKKNPIEDEKVIEDIKESEEDEDLSEPPKYRPKKKSSLLTADDLKLYEYILIYKVQFMTHFQKVVVQKLVRIKYHYHLMKKMNHKKN